MTPVGDIAQTNPVLKQLGLTSLGRSARSHVLLTRTLLLIAQEGTTKRQEIRQESGNQRGVTAGTNFDINDPKLRAYDKVTGKLIGELSLPRNATGAPMTYLINGQQFIAIPTGGANLPAELIVLHLPR